MDNEYKIEELNQKTAESNAHLYRIEENIESINAKLTETNAHLKILSDWTKVIGYTALISFFAWLFIDFSDSNLVRHWDFVSDMNGDGRESIRDLWLYFHWSFFYPGDWVIKYLSDFSFGRYWELSANDYGGFLSSLISFIVIFSPLSVIIWLFFRNSLPGENKLLRDASIGILVTSFVLIMFFIYLMIFVFIAQIIFS